MGISGLIYAFNSPNRFDDGHIWINDQWRVCFRWGDGDAGDVEIVDYH